MEIQVTETQEQTDNRFNADFLSDIKVFSRFGPLISSGVSVVCTAFLLPIFLYIVASQMAPAYELATIKGSLHRALMVMLPLIFVTVLLLKTTRPKGMAERHFGWDPTLCNSLYRWLWCVVWLWLPMKFSCVVLETFAEGQFQDSLGRLSYAVGMIVITAGSMMFIRRVSQWRDSKLNAMGLNHTATQRRQSRENLLNGGPVNVDHLIADPWTRPLRQMALLIVPAASVTLMFLSLSGFHFTATEMSWRAMWTILGFMLIGVGAGLVSRLLLITQFRIKLRQLNESGKGKIGEAESINIAAISSQVNQLLRVTAMVAMTIVAWQIWAEVSPTIAFLNSVELWEAARKSVDEPLKMITLGHLLMAVGMLVITFALSRNLPGLLEITILERLPLDKGGRYAISFIVRYLVGLLGTLFTFQVAGFSWSSVQWLAAGLTVGLGFGLQEIFANLVSGIIILIERPIRVGDMVTVNNTTGTVTQMQLRATTIRDLDLRELIVPNKKFITEDVMNWTLSDQISRMILNVGVAYKSDTELVQSTLLAAARKHPLIVRYPQPEVVFREFGDSTLNFELRVMIPRRDLYAKLQHELNMSINKLFRENGIEIAFPQREVRVVGGEAAELVVPHQVGPTIENTEGLQKAG